jgi:hypothetical protein
MRDDQYRGEALTLIQERIEQLRTLSLADADAIAEVSGEDELVLAGKKCSIMVFSQRSPYNLPQSLLVTVLVSRARFGSIASAHIERGVVFSLLDGTVRDATDLELRDSGG